MGVSEFFVDKFLHGDGSMGMGDWGLLGDGSMRQFFSGWLLSKMPFLIK